MLQHGTFVDALKLSQGSRLLHAFVENELEVKADQLLASAHLWRLSPYIVAGDARGVKKRRWALVALFWSASSEELYPMFSELEWPIDNAWRPVIELLPTMHTTCSTMHSMLIAARILDMVSCICQDDSENAWWAVGDGSGPWHVDDEYEGETVEIVWSAFADEYKEILARTRDVLDLKELLATMSPIGPLLKVAERFAESIRTPPEEWPTAEGHA